MEDCPIGKVKEPFRRKWNEGGRGYKLELHNNKVGRFLPCSIVCIEEKRFSLVFLEGNVPKSRPLEEFKSGLSFKRKREVTIC